MAGIMTNLPELYNLISVRWKYLHATPRF